MGKMPDVEYSCQENEDGKLVCQVEDDEGVCEQVLVPDGHGGFKLKADRGHAPTCEKAKQVVEQKT